MPVNDAAMFSGDALIAADHPSFAGHFPGNPVVPGVLLLDSIAVLLNQWKPGCRITGIAQAKFHRILQPEQRIAVTFTEQNPQHIKFECLRSGEKIASGLLTIEFRP